MFRSAFCIENGARVFFGELITEYAMHGLRVDAIEVFPLSENGDFAGVAHIHVFGPNSVLSYLRHKHNYVVDESAHWAAVELKKSWLTM